jgi:hypothetical protein
MDRTMICRTRNFCFVHIPKTGGTSIENAMFPGHNFCSSPDYEHLYGWDAEYGWLNHLTLKEMRKLCSVFFVKKPTVFAVVRNPWDRLVSEFAWKRFKRKAGITFAQFVRRLYKRDCYELERYYRDPLAFKQHLKPQHEYILSDYPIEVLRFESLQMDFNRILSKMGMGRILLPILRESKRKHYCQYYTPESMNMVYEIYQKDIDLFNFSFQYKVDLPPLFWSLKL